MNKRLKIFFGTIFLSAVLFCVAAFCQAGPGQALVEKGRKYLYEKQYDQALEELNKAIESDPDMFEAYDVRGAVYFFQKNYEAAIADYDMALELDPQASGIYRSRGESYYMLRDYDKAIEDFNAAIELDQDEMPEDYNYRAQAYAAQGQYQLALQDLNKVLEMDEFAADYRLLAETYMQIGDYGKVWEVVGMVDSMYPPSSGKTAADYFEAGFLDELKAASGRNK